MSSKNGKSKIFECSIQATERGIASWYSDAAPISVGLHREWHHVSGLGVWYEPF